MRDLKLGDKIFVISSPDFGNSQCNKLYKVVDVTRTDNYVSIKQIGTSLINPIGNSNSGSIGSKWSFRPEISEFIFVGEKEEILSVLEDRMRKIEEEKENLTLIIEIATEGISNELSKEEYLYNYLEVQKEKGASKETLLKIMKVVNNEPLFKALSASCKA